MARRDELLSEWRSRLAECERQEEMRGEGSRWTWLRRMYAQVLRYLISRYGEAGVADEPDVSEARSRMPFHEATEVGSGKPARSGDAIRTALDSIHGLNPPATPPGPMVQGVTAEDLMIAESFRDRGEAARAAEWLARQSVTSRRKRAGRMTQIWVRRADYEMTRAILESQGFPHVRRVVPTNRASWTPLLALVGFFAGGVVMLLEGALGVVAGLFLVAGLLLGLACGVIIDIWRHEG